MKKEKKSPRSKMLEHRHHKTSRSHHKRSSESRERHAKHHRSSRSPSTSKRKLEEEKEYENPKPTSEVRSSTVKMEVSDLAEAEKDWIVFENVINDKEKLIQELFEAVSEENLKKITPDSLKNCPLEELKIMCLEELNRMTNAEIIYILSGKDPASFDPSSHSEVTKEQKTLLVPIAEDKEEDSKQDVKETVADKPRSPHPERLKELIASKRISADDEQESTSSVTGDTKSEAESDSLELCATQKEIDSLIQEEILNQTGAHGLSQQAKSDLTDMEILELELRARIIRSLLRNHGMEISDEEGLQQKENVGIKEKGND